MAETTAEAPAVAPGEQPAGARTIAALWREAVVRQPPSPAYLEERDDGWRPVSFPEAARRVDELAHGLLSLGVGKGDTFAILARTRLEWSLLDFALPFRGDGFSELRGVSARPTSTVVRRRTAKHTSASSSRASRRRRCAASGSSGRRRCRSR